MGTDPLPSTVDKSDTNESLHNPRTSLTRSFSDRYTETLSVFELTSLGVEGIHVVVLLLLSLSWKKCDDDTPSVVHIVFIFNGMFHVE